jgi:lipopolysaccharide/colanic/teichoic acid biosynthesis glycosyltransferase
MFQLDKYPLEQGSQRPSISPFQSISKRGFDVVVATAGLLLLSPLVILISIAIRSDSPGPIVCRHKRYGIDSTAFDLFEFRTTLARPEEETVTHSTRFGQLLRRSGMDKIPQLANVIRGEMSIVGPHPFATAPEIVVHLPEAHNARPGLVSWAQVNDDLGETVESAESLDCRIEYDRYYLKNRSFSFDMRILLLALLSHRTYLQR